MEVVLNHMANDFIKPIQQNATENPGHLQLGESIPGWSVHSNASVGLLVLKTEYFLGASKTSHCISHHLAGPDFYTL